MLAAVLVVGERGRGGSRVTRRPTTPTPSLTLASQDPWTPNSGTFTMSLKTGGNTDGLQLTLTVHDRVLSRSAFDATLGDSPTFPQTLTLQRLSLDDYPADANGVRVVQVDLTRPQHPPFGQRRVPDRGAAPRRQRHHPSRASSPTSWSSISPPRLRSRSTSPGCGRSSPPRRSRSTALRTRTSSASSRPPGDSAVRPRRSAPTPTCPSRSRRVPRRSTRGSSSRRHRTTPSSRRASTHCGGRCTHHQVLAGSFVPLDLPSTRRAGSAAPSATSSTGHRTRSRRFFNTHLDPSTAMPGDLDTPSLDALRNAVRTRLVVDGSALEPFDGRFTVTRPALLGRARGQCVQTQVDGRRHRSRAWRVSSTATRLRRSARRISSARSRSSRASSRAWPGRWHSPTRTIGIHPTSSSPRCSPGSARIRFVRPVTVDTLLAETPAATVDDAPDGDPVVRTLAPATVRKAPVKAAVTTTRACSTATRIAALFGNTDPRVAHADRTLLSVLSANLENPAGRRFAREQLHAIGQSGRDFLSLIHSPEQSTITLTSSEAKIPLTFRNDTDKSGPDPHRARERQARCSRTAPIGTSQLEPGKNQTVRIAVETRSSGSFPLLMTVTTAGGLPIQTSEVTVRSSFVSGVGRVPHCRCDRVPRTLVGLGHPPPTSPTPPDGVNDDPTDTSQFDDPQLDAPQFDSPQFDAPGFEPRRLRTSRVGEQRRVEGHALERGGRGRHRALTTHRVRAHRRDRLRARCHRARRHVQLRERDARTSSTSCSSAACSPRRSCRCSCGTSSRTTRTRPPPSSPSRSWCSSPSPWSASCSRPGSSTSTRCACTDANRAQQQAARHRPVAAVHAADALLRHRDPRDRDAQRASAASWPRRSRPCSTTSSSSRCSSCSLVSPTGSLSVHGVLDDQALLLLMGLGTTAGIVVMALVLLPALHRAHVHLRYLPAFRHPAVRHARAPLGMDVGYVIANQIALFVVTCSGTARPAGRSCT